jgi:hypothetical protein
MTFDTGTDLIRPTAQPGQGPGVVDVIPLCDGEADGVAACAPIRGGPVGMATVTVMPAVRTPPPQHIPIGETTTDPKLASGGGVASMHD